MVLFVGKCGERTPSRVWSLICKNILFVPFTLSPKTCRTPPQKLDEWICFAKTKFPICLKHPKRYLFQKHHFWYLCKHQGVCYLIQHLKTGPCLSKLPCLSIGPLSTVQTQALQFCNLASSGVFHHRGMSRDILGQDPMRTPNTPRENVLK